MATDDAGRDQTQGANVITEFERTLLGVPLFQRGDFTLNSGARSSWKLECDSLSDADWDGVAAMARILVPQFSDVVGVPRGGLKLAERLRPFANPCSCTYAHQPHDYCDGTVGPRPVLIVDDVLTTGGSMERLRKDVMDHLANTDPNFSPIGRAAGLVLFARGQCPWWINAIFQMPEPFWLQSATRGDPVRLDGGGRGA